MAESSTFRFQVLLNGEPVCTAGVPGDFGTMAVIADWILRPELDTHPGFVEFSVTGRGYPSEWGPLYGWAKQRLAAGDELTIRVLGPGQCDEAPRRNP